MQYIDTNERRNTNERRSKFRFGIEREVRYKVAGNGLVGVGQTLDICSGGVAFTSQQPLTAGTFAELSISWPVLLDETCPMRLVIFGRLLEGAELKAVCTIDKYEFRTQSRALQANTVARSDGMLQRWAEGMRRETLKARLDGF